MNKKRFFVGIFICFLSISAFSKGSAEKDYASAKSHLEASENSAALENIVQVIENKPESIESGISLAREGMKNQAEFQQTFHNLIELLKEEPNNNIERIAMIDRMEALESDIDPSLREFLNKLKTSSFYAIYRIKFNDIMDEGIALINEIRHRAGFSTAVDLTTTNQNEARLLLRHERQVELACEEDRYFDVRRWTPADQNMENEKFTTGMRITKEGTTFKYQRFIVGTDGDKPSKMSYEKKWHLYPIPISEVSVLNEKTGKNWQNAGW